MVRMVALLGSPRRLVTWVASAGFVAALTHAAIVHAESPPHYVCTLGYCCNSYPVAITTGPDGTLYLTVQTFQHGTVERLGTQCDFAGPTAAYVDVAPTSTAVDGDGVLYVASSSCNCVRKMVDPVEIWGGTGSNPGEFHGLAAIAIDADNYVYAADIGNHRVQKLMLDGTPALSFGTYGTGPGQLGEPNAIAVDRMGHVFVTDQLNDKVLKYTTAGDFVTEWGSHGTEPGLFDQPFGIAADGHGAVYVADVYNGRMQKFTDSGAFLSEWLVLDGTWVFDVTVDAAGAIYVVAPYHGVLKYEPSTTAVEGEPPVSLRVEPPAPNPFRDELRFAWHQPTVATTEVSLIDVTGRRVALLAAGEWPAGRHERKWSASRDGHRDLAAGLYWIRVRSNGREAAQRVTRLP